MNRRVWAMLVVLSLAASAVSVARADGAEPTRADRFAQANEVFRRALDTIPADPDRGSVLALQAAALYRSIADDGVRNHRLELNAGNASFLAGDVGRAVLAFRRAESLNAASPEVKSSLAVARGKVGTKVAPSAGTKAADWVRRATRAIPPKFALAILAVTYVLGWTIAVLRVRGARTPRWWGISAGLVALTLTGLIVFDEWRATTRPDAVIVQPSTIGLTGPARGVYPPTFTTPLAPGVECVVLETRGEWAHIRLPSGATTWVPANSIERV